MKALLRQFFAPLRCEACQTKLLVAEALCLSCMEQQRRLRTQHCRVCALPFEGSDLRPHLCSECLDKLPSFAKVYAGFEWNEVIAKLIHAAKFKQRPHSLKILCEPLRGDFAAVLSDFSPDYLLPMPLSWRRRWQRGFNQSRLILTLLGQDAKIPLLKHIRRRHLSPQARLDRQTRLKRLKNIFFLKASQKIPGKKVLILDDILTTGATVEALSAELKKKGASEVRVFVLARVAKHPEIKKEKVA